ncbi:unnamed protein product [Dracunculus medinensis]|uniref:Leucine zipper transcription factor-like protein 1 n=1 Tax=Dracunculus medinensis TaxID=318479 RepID=A0A0N4UB47_DRAME|nr:unnamed protein product [Dracunculus medinensis]
MNLSELEDRELLDAVRIFEDEHFEQKTTKTATILQKLVALEGTIQERAERESEGIIQMRNMIEALVVELDKSKTENERHQMNQAKLVEELLSLKEEELEKKFEATNAYKTMKQILKQKNYQIKQLRMKNANNSGDSDQE